MKPISKRALTIQDVARSSGVSAKTVSRVINNEPGVHPETRAHVAQIVKELDFRPNLLAQSLAGDRSFLLGLFIENPGSYVTDFQTGVIERCREAGYHLIVEPWKPGDPDLSTKVLNLLRQLRLDGVILLPPHCDDPAVLDVLDKEGVPMIRIAPINNRADCPVIRAHDYVASRLMTAHLLNLGHRNIGFIRGCTGHSAATNRLQAFIDEMTQQGVEVNHDLIYPGDFSFDLAEVSARKMLSRPDPPSAIFASNDESAFAVLVVAQRMGVRVPEDLSVTGFDDTPVSRMTWPQITTVRQPVKEIGWTAADLLISHSPRRKGWPDPMPNKLLDFEIIVRESTGPAKSRPEE
ncbi:MAG TPA: LacI family DNA-binding transcriptional regulator [Magnetospirillaceae bacterium]|nr:LacI family DNA-binding transcriptional regulator [Magnetospirillaceae bacterium]